MPATCWSGERLVDSMNEPRSGLRNPTAAVRGVGAGALAVEAVVMLLAIAPLAKLGGPDLTPAIWLVVVLAVTAGVLAGLLRHPWAWWAGLVVPLALLGGGVVHWSLAALGVIFALLWGYVLNVRRTVLGASTTDGPPSG
jgi:hypothetical protein